MTTLLLLSPTVALAQAAQEFDHAAWDRVLKRFVNSDGQVDYGALRSDRAEFDAYLARLAERSPDSHPAAFPNREAQLAYWINAYNAFTIRGVSDQWPTRSVRDLGFLFGFFRKSVYVAGGRTYSLNDIEHGIIRKRFGEPRIHFALVCASISCPRLQNEAYVAEKLEAQLHANTIAFINEVRNVRFDPARNRVTLSKIFDWYEDDFATFATEKNLPGAATHPVLAYLRLYLNEAGRKAFDSMTEVRTAYFDYDWGVNDVSAMALKR